GYRFTYRGPIRLFIEMMFLYGSAFDTDSQYPWAGKILLDPDEQMERAERLCDQILDYQKKVSGPEASNTRRALRELSVRAREPATLPSGDFVAAMRQEMSRIFPEKMYYIAH